MIYVTSYRCYDSNINDYFVHVTKRIALFIYYYLKKKKNETGKNDPSKNGQQVDLTFPHIIQSFINLISIVITIRY